MLTSSDAKWRCMWYMLIWSIQMALVSQFLDITDHVAFFLFAGVSVLILPVFTAIYSNTSGRHGAGLIRVGYVFMDPVIACLIITPVMTLSRLPKVLDLYHCLENITTVTNTTIECLDNDTTALVLANHQEKDHLMEQQRSKFLIIQGCILMPVVLALFMGRRTRKMNCKTYILTFTYWLVVAIEASGLLETALLCIDYKHVIFTTEAIVSIIMIITNSYAVITLCSYLTPMTTSSYLPKTKYSKKFDLVYKMFVGCAGALFVEIPLVIARFQIMITSNVHTFLYGTFYIWLLKDVLFICLIIIMMVLQGNIRMRLKKASCRPKFDNTDVIFEPEKRDTYIYHHHHRQKAPSPILTPQMIKDRFQSSSLSSSMNSSKTNSCEEIAPITHEKDQFHGQDMRTHPKTKKKVTFKLEMGSRFRDTDHLFPM